MTSRTYTLPAAVGAVLLATVLAACSGPAAQTSGSATQAPTTQTSGSTPSGTPTPSTPKPAAVSFRSNVKNGASKVGVDTLVKVSASAGTVSKVKLSYTGKNSKGKTAKGTVHGALSKDHKSWAATERLEPGTSYRLAMSGKNAASQASNATTSFRTKNLSLSKQTFPSLYPLKGSTVGVGMPVVLNFDVAVKDKKSIEKNLHVTSSPAQAGSWRWFSNTEVRYRPAKYWKPGTKVTVHADVNGVKAGNGVYGQSSAKTSFKVGRSMIIKINLASDVAHVYRNGKMVRRILVSAGKPGWQSRSGIKLIMDKEYNKKMTNEMIGAKEKYSLTAAYAMRITNSGEFLHSAPWNAGYFGRVNHSHGCTGMSTSDAAYLISHTLIGDPVITTGTSSATATATGTSPSSSTVRVQQSDLAAPTRRLLAGDKARRRPRNGSGP
jgi:lipoprotein-anchoring transpeptidase ErfK/SrfK